MKLNMRRRAVMSIFLFCSVLPAPADVSPTQAYLSIRQKEIAAKTYEDLLPLRTKESISHDEKHSPEETAMMMDIMRASIPKNIKVTNEVITGDVAILTFQALPEKVATSPDQMEERGTGTIKMGLEDGKWKLDHEAWKMESKSAGQFAQGK